MNIRTSQSSLLVDFVIQYPELVEEISRRLKSDIINIELSFYEFSKETQYHTRIRRPSLKGLQYKESQAFKEGNTLKIQLVFK